jgi:hypothetical protein
VDAWKGLMMTSLGSVFGRLKRAEDDEDEVVAEVDRDDPYAGSVVDDKGYMNWPQWTEATPASLEKLAELCAGRSGNHEAEANVYWSRYTEDLGFVEAFTARGSDVAACIKRCGPAITHFKRIRESVWLRIRVRMPLSDEDIAAGRTKGRKVFRGWPMAFANLNPSGEKMPSGLWDKE